MPYTPQNSIGLYAYTHSGSTYLLNILLELNICIFRNDFSTFWKIEKNTYILSEAERIDLGVWFPRFQRDPRFKFQSKNKIFWTHSLPNKTQIKKKGILLIRDPRDTLVSAYYRVAQDKPWDQFLNTPFPDSPLEMIPTDDWAIYNHLIFSIFSKEQLLILKFEDLKRQPLQEIIKVLKFIDVENIDMESSSLC